MRSSPTLLALVAIALWSSLAVLGTLLQHVPPFLLMGIVLMAPPFLRGLKLIATQLIAARAGSMGAAIGTLSDPFFVAKLVGVTSKAYFWGNTIGHVMAAVAAFIWARWVQRFSCGTLHLKKATPAKSAS